MTRRVLDLGCLFFLSAAGLAGAQTVHVVDASVGQVEFLDVVDNAASGDTILVKGSGSYVLAIDGKSLAIAADDGATPNLSQVQVRNVPAGGRVTIRGFRIFGGTSFGTVVTLENNAGSVWIEDAHVRYSRAFPALGPAGGIGASNCASVVMRSCLVEPDLTSLFPALGSGISASATSMALFDVTSIGGNGYTSVFPIGSGPGGPGVYLSGGSLFGSGCSFTGGVGGNAPLEAPAPGPGGPGFVVDGAAELRDSQLAGGAPGVGALGPGVAGAPSVVQANGSLATPPGAARHFSISSPVRELQNATYVATGLAGEGVGVLFSLAPIQGTPFPFFESVLALDLSIGDAYLLGTIPAGGTLTVPHAMPALPPPFDGVTFFEQAFFFDLPTTHLVLGPASTVLILDASL